MKIYQVMEDDGSGDMTLRYYEDPEMAAVIGEDVEAIEFVEVRKVVISGKAVVRSVK